MTESKHENKPKEGRVAQILNAKELVINIGRESGVKDGQIFAVMAESPIEIRDPVTNDLLDRIDREKVRVKAAEVREKITICRTFRQFHSVASQIGLVNSAMLEAFRESRPETLRIEDDSTPPPLTEEESYVKVNDRVIAVS